MSTIKSSAENLTLNADGANNDVIIQSNASTKVTVDGALGNVGIAVAPEAWNSSYKALQLSSTNSALYATTRRTGLAEGALKNAAGNWQFQGSGDKAGLYEIDDSTSTHKLSVSNGTGSTGGTITFLTGFEVLNDGKARAPNGLLFGTDTAAANALDDYEEGTWTPTLTEGTNTNASYDNRSGNYVKIGRTVFVEARINITSLGSISGNLRLAGLPFNVSNTVGSRATMNSGWAVGLDITAGQNISGYANGTTDYFWLTLWANAAGTSNLTHSTLSADGGFMMSATYTTDS